MLQQLVAYVPSTCLLLVSRSQTRFLPSLFLGDVEAGVGLATRD